MQPVNQAVDFCLVCENIKAEMGQPNKVNIFGYYGLLPRVRIVLDMWDRPLENLTFLVSTHGLTKPYSAQLRLINPSGTYLINSIVVTGEPVTDNVSTSAIAFAFPMLRFQQQGEHRVQVSIDNQPAYDQTFLVQSSRPTVKL
jgi:hypothetical protein